MIYLKKVVKHFHLVNKHRFYVFKFCLKAGIPFRGQSILMMNFGLVRPILMV